jgi:hypothetical protein
MGGGKTPPKLKNKMNKKIETQVERKLDRINGCYYSGLENYYIKEYRKALCIGFLVGLIFTIITHL